MERPPAGGRAALPVAGTRPRAPTKTRAVIPTRGRSVCPGAGPVTGSDVWPASTCTAPGAPAAVGHRPRTSGAWPGFLARLAPTAASAWGSPAPSEAVTSSHPTGGAPPSAARSRPRGRPRGVRGGGPGAPARQRGVCSQAVQPPRRGDGVVGRPPDRRAAGPRRGDACAAQHQDAWGPALGPPPPAPSDALGERLEDPEAGDDGATDGVQGPGEAITRALKGASPGLDPRRRPRGQIGAGARVPLGAGAAGFAPAPGGGRLAIGDGCSIQASWPNRNIPGRPDHDRDVHAYRTAFTRGAQLNFQRDSRKDWGEDPTDRAPAAPCLPSSRMFYSAQEI